MLRHRVALKHEPWIPATGLFPDLRADWPSDKTGGRALLHPLGHAGRLRLAVADRTLEIAIDVAVAAGYAAPEMPEWYLRDHFAVFFDPNHDHTTRRMLALERSGAVHAEDTWHLCGEEVSDVQFRAMELPPVAHEAVVVETPSGWRARLRVDIDSLAGRVDYPSVPIGLKVKLCMAGPVVHEAPCWPERDEFWKDNCFGFGDILSSDPPLEVTEVDFGEPVWKAGPRSSTIHIRGTVREKRIAGGWLDLSVTDALGGTRTSRHSWKARDGKLDMTAPVDYPFTSKWAPDILSIARVSLDFRDSAGGQLWSASYPFGFDAGIIVREPFGMIGADRPDASAPDFVDAHRAWLLSTLPHYSWRTTRDGAPSDFYLESSDGKGHLDLMSPAVFHDMAIMIRERFVDWQDALCAASMLLHHPCLTVHSSSWARVATNAATGTVLRLGGCFCSDCSRVGSRLAEEVGRLFNVPLKAYSLSLRGHLATLVRCPIGDTVIDPMLGAYYFTLDNTRLATLDELRTDLRVQQRVWLNAFNHGHEFFHGVYNQVVTPWLDGPAIFPPL